MSRSQIHHGINMASFGGYAYARAHATMCPGPGALATMRKRVRQGPP